MADNEQISFSRRLAENLVPYAPVSACFWDGHKSCWISFDTAKLPETVCSYIADDNGQKRSPETVLKFYHKIKGNPEIETAFSKGYADGLVKLISKHDEDGMLDALREAPQELIQKMPLERMADAFLDAVRNTGMFIKDDQPHEERVKHIESALHRLEKNFPGIMKLIDDRFDGGRRFAAPPGTNTP